MAEDTFDLSLLDPKIEVYATETEKSYVKIYRDTKSLRKTAEVAQVTRNSVRNSLRRLVMRAAKAGFSPEHDQIHPAPPGQFVKGVSTLYTPEGKVAAQWVKTAHDTEAFRHSIEEFANALGENIERAPVVAPPEGQNDSHLLTVYPMGDPHIGMYAWHEEAGEDFDLNIASNDLYSAMSILNTAVPPTETALILNLGDFFHTDTIDNKTRRSGHNLDVDTRWPRVMQVGARLMMDAVKLALTRHQNVIVKNLIGNHDDQSSIALGLILDAYYRDEPRVTVDLSPAIFWYYMFGNTLIGATHGNTIKLPDLASIMAADRAVDWGQSQYRYWYTGHIHTKTVLELAGGVIVESFRTLAAKDAWTAGQGYRSGRDMNAIILHKDYGEIARHRVDIRYARGS